MHRNQQDESICSVVRALDLLGDRWSLALIREVVFGTRRFDDFAAHLGIARNVLSNRLARLVAAGILVQAPLRTDGTRMGYKLGAMGEDLIPVLVALMQWGDRWLQTPATIPLRLLERGSGREIPRMQVRGAAGHPLGLRELDWAPGPGAGNPRAAALIAAYEAQRRVEPRPIPPAPSPKTATAKTAKPQAAAARQAATRKTAAAQPKAASRTATRTRRTAP
jgi:DNA-binding HxlR family transcriptional regulator